jgi:glucose-1-phosphate thymidylyltransferase
MLSSPATKAVILARGLGTRMRRSDPTAPPLDASQAAVAETGVKAMMPVGRPFLDYVLSTLAEAGYREVCLVIGPEHDAVRERYNPRGEENVGRRTTRLRIAFGVQPQPTGTADAVVAAEAFVDGERFLVINSDNLYPVEALHGLRLLEGAGLAAFSAAGLVEEGEIPAARVARWPVVKQTPDHWLAGLEERGEGDGQPGDEEYVSVNCWMFTPAIFQACRAVPPSAGGERELPAAVRHALAQGERFRVLPLRSPVLDLTSRADVASVARRLASVEVRL